jgi:hypothetical protein
MTKRYSNSKPLLASSKPKTLKINSWLRDSAEMIANVGITSALLDAEIILAHTLRKSRTWLHAHGEEELSSRELDIASARLELRLDRTPIAYIIGHKEFYSRLFKVTPSVLIPRPESEAIITQFLALPLPDKARVIDVGTGSGCLGITTKLERIDDDTHYDDIITTAMRTHEGVDLKRLKPEYRDYALCSAKSDIDGGLLELTNDHLRLTRKGLFVSDMVMSNLMKV